MRGHALFCLLLSLALVGCARTGRPFWYGNQATQAQRLHQAERFDPYPENETGPSIEEVRPYGFERNVAEPKRARWWERMGFGYSSQAVP